MTDPPRVRKAKEHIDACNRLALALVTQTKHRHVQIDMQQVADVFMCHVRIELHEGTSWSGEELHTLQEFCYEHGARLRFNNEHDGLFLIIWPYDEEDHDGLDEP